MTNDLYASSCSPDGYLFHSVMDGNLALAETLLAGGADISFDSDIILRGASRRGLSDAVRFCVENGAFVEACDNDPVIMAADSGHSDILEYLVSVGGDVRAREDEVLILGAGGGHLEVVRFILSCAGETAWNGAGAHALAMASLGGHLDVARLLVEHGSPLYGFGNDSLVSAATGGNVEMAQYLLSCGANIALSGKDAIVECISSFAPTLDMVKLLIKHGAPLNSAIESAREHNAGGILPFLNRLQYAIEERESIEHASRGSLAKTSRSIAPGGVFKRL